MEAMRNTWTDERLDDGFARVTTDIHSLREETVAMHRDLRQEIGSVRRELRQEIGSVRDEIGSVRNEVGAVRQNMNARFAHMEGRFDGLQRTLMLTGGGIIAALLGIIATQL